MATKKGTKKTSSGFTADERAAMKDRAREAKAEASRKGKGDGEADLLAKVAEMPLSDRRMAKRLHAIMKDVAPELEAKTWYGMPAYARDGKIVCFFQAAAKFKARYATLGFNDAAMLDAGAMWPTSFALTELGDAEERKIRTLVKKSLR